MQTQPSSTSATPILDLIEPLPARSGKFTARGALISFLTMAGTATFVFLVLSQPDLLRRSLPALAPIVDFMRTLLDRPGAALLIVGAGWLFALLAHEGGHLLAARLVGCRPEGLSLGFFTLSWEEGRPKLLLHRSRGIAGMAMVRVENATRIHRKMAVMIAGGPLASLLFGAVVLLAARFIDEPISLRVALQCVGGLSLFLGAANLLPFRAAGWHTDGARLRALARPGQARPWLCLILALEQHRHGHRLKDLNRRWLRAALDAPEGSLDNLQAALLVYGACAAKKDVETAALWLEKCLRQSGLGNGVMQDMLAMQAANFQGWYRRDAEKLERWLERVKRPKTLPEVMHAAVRVSRHCARQEFSEALQAWRAGMELVQKLPEGPQRSTMSEAWLEWKQEIEERAAQAGIHQSAGASP